MERIYLYLLKSNKLNMKKFLFSLLTAASGFTFVHAQQMNYYVNMVGSVGDNFIIAQDQTITPGDADFNPGTVGANVVWNFQGLDTDNLDTIHFLAPNGQETTDFPGCNLVNESNLGRIVFNKDVTNGLFLMGTNLSFQGVALSLNYTPTQLSIPAVCSLGTTGHTVSLVDEQVYVGIDSTIAVGPFTCHIQIDSIGLERRSDYTVNFDATGELRLPLDTFPYTLRAISKEITLDSVFIYCPNGITDPTCATFGLSAPVGWSLAPDNLVIASGFATGAVVLDSSYTAGWYNPYTVAPICIVDFDYDSAYQDTNIYSIRFKGTDTPDVGFEQADQIDMKLFPNPANSILMLQTSAVLTESTMYVYNVQGQQVKATRLNNSNTVDVSGLTDGMYFYQLTDGKKLLHHGKFIIKK
jgi:hypothetical protein